MIEIRTMLENDLNFIMLFAIAHNAERYRNNSCWTNPLLRLWIEPSNGLASKGQRNICLISHEIVKERKIVLGFILASVCDASGKAYIEHLVVDSKCKPRDRKRVHHQLLFQLENNARNRKLGRIIMLDPEPEQIESLQGDHYQIVTCTGAVWSLLRQ